MNHKIALVGLGKRGQALLTDAILPVCEAYDAEVAAVYDVYKDRVEAAVKTVYEKTGKNPSVPESYEALLADDQISAVIIATSWETHISMAVAAMKAGKYVAFEVGGAYNIEDCWKLVDTYEETGVPCMFLENCCYGKYETMVLNMVRQGILGEIVHCSGGYHHDVREEVANGEKDRHYRLRNYINRNCENYPTHELGPIAKVLDINHGNRMVSLTSTASCAKGLHAYILDKEGADSPLANQEFLQGDVVTTAIRCAKGQTIVLTLDTTLPRAYNRCFTVRGTKAGYFGASNMVFEQGVHDEFEWEEKKLWDNGEEYFKQYAHPLWKDYDPVGGHGGMDYLVVSAFLDSVVNKTLPPIDVYDAASYMCITALSEESILKGGAPVMIPDFTRGKWYYRDAVPDSKYKLNR